MLQPAIFEQTSVWLDNLGTKICQAKLQVSGFEILELQYQSLKMSLSRYRQSLNLVIPMSPK